MHNRSVLPRRWPSLIRGLVPLAIAVALVLGHPAGASAQGGITIDKTANKTTVNKDETITYTITVTNSGPSREVNVSDTIPFRTHYVQGSLSSNPAGATYSGGQITWAGVLGTGQKVVIRYTVLVAEPETEGPLPIINRAYANDLYDEEEVWAYGPGPTPTPQPKKVLPVLTKRADRAEALPGEEVVFTIEVTNEGQAAAVDVVVIDDIPEYLEVLEATTTQGTVTIEGQRVMVEVGVVGPDFVVQIVIRTRVREDAPAPVAIENIAMFRAPNAKNLETPPLVVSVPGPLLPTSGNLHGWWPVLLYLGGALIALGAAWRLYLRLSRGPSSSG